tara:strand:+ start:331 stop:1017 length:687 start_codon:yes stop_codon:yes gene_type:complete
MAGINQIKPIKRPTKARKTTNKALADTWLEDVIDASLEGVMEAPKAGVFYPSSLGNPCDRYLWLCYNGLMIEQNLPANLERIFQNGSSLEDRVDRWFSKLNILVERELSVKQDIPPISGRIDFIINHATYNHMPVELKSINTNGFSKLRSPKPEHAVQIQMYLNMGGYDIGTVLYENKNDQKIKSFLVERDTKAWDEILARCFNVQEMIARPDECTGATWCACRKVED